MLCTALSQAWRIPIEDATKALENCAVDEESALGAILYQATNGSALVKVLAGPQVRLQQRDIQLAGGRTVRRQLAASGEALKAMGGVGDVPKDAWAMIAAAGLGNEPEMVREPIDTTAQAVPA